MSPMPKKEDPFDIQPDTLLFSDLHLHDRKEFSRMDPITGLNTRLAEGLSILDQIIEVCKMPSIKHAFFLGDVFERKDSISNHILIEFGKRLEQFTEIGVVLFCLRGNHDFSLPNYPIPSLFENEPYFHFVDKLSEILDKIVFIPFHREWEDFEKDWKDVDKLKPDVVCFHQEIPGGVYESGKPIPGIWTLKTDPDILYLSGHLHRPQKVHGIQFLGSPYPIKFSDEGQDRFVWLYNSKTRELRPLKLKYSEFVSINIYEENNYFNIPKESEIHGNYIRIVGEVQKEEWNQEMKKNLKEECERLGAKAVAFNIKIKQKNQPEISEESILGDTELIRKYAKENKGEMNLKSLEETGLEVWESL